MSREDTLQNMIRNAMSMRVELIRTLTNPNWELYRDCKYPATSDVTADYCRDLYDREPLANRAVRLMAMECWQQPPNVYEDESPTSVTAFEEAWDRLCQQLRGEQSWFIGEEGSLVWDYLKRLDIAAGIGYFAVLFFGFDDGKPLDQPVDGVVSYTRNSTPSTEVTVTKAGEPYAAIGTDAQYAGVQLGPSEYPSAQPNAGEVKLLYCRVFDETLVQVVQYEADLRNPRFGMPVMYRVTLTDPRDTQVGGIGLSMSTLRVHWSRLLHLPNDNIHCSEVFSPPKLRPIINPILDVQKVRGGGAEGQWRGAFPGYSLETNPQMGPDVDVNYEELDDMMAEYYSGLTRTLQLIGMQAKPLTPQTNDPTPHINAATEAICIQLACPVRVFKGSERGELASSQDDASWNDRVKERCNGYVTPRIVVPFIDRLISAGVLPVPGGENGKRSVRDPGAGAGKPANGVRGGNGENAARNRGQNTAPTAGYFVEWPARDSNTATEKATIGLTKMQTISTYVTGQCETVLPPEHMFTAIMGMDEEQAKEVLEGAVKAQEPLTMPPAGDPGHPATAMPDPMEQAKLGAKMQVDVAKEHAKAPGFGSTTVSAAEPPNGKPPNGKPVNGQSAKEPV